MTKKEITNKCKELRDKYMYKQVEKEDFDWLIENVFKFHPDWNTYFAPKYVIGMTAKHNKNNYCTKCFYLIYADGTQEDISWNKSIENK